MPQYAKQQHCFKPPVKISLHITYPPSSEGRAWVVNLDNDNQWYMIAHPRSFLHTHYWGALSFLHGSTHFKWGSVACCKFLSWCFLIVWELILILLNASWHIFLSFSFLHSQQRGASSFLHTHVKDAWELLGREAPVHDHCLTSEHWVGFALKNQYS